MPTTSRTTEWCYSSQYDYPNRTVCERTQPPEPPPAESPYPKDLADTTIWDYDSWPGAYVGPAGVQRAPTPVYDTVLTLTDNNVLTGSWTFYDSDLKPICDEVKVTYQADDETMARAVDPQFVNLIDQTFGPVTLRLGRTYTISVESCYATICTPAVGRPITTGDLPAEEVIAVGLRVEGGDAGFGAYIQQPATIELTSFGDYTGYFEARIYGVLEVNPPAFSETAGEKPSDRPKTADYVTWAFQTTWATNEKHKTPDIQPLLQQIVNQVGYTSPQMVAFVIEPISGTRVFWGHDDAIAGNQEDNKPLLEYTYAPALLEDQLKLAEPLVKHGDDYVQHNGSYVRYG